MVTYCWNCVHIHVNAGGLSSGVCVRGHDDRLRKKWVRCCSQRETGMSLTFPQMQATKLKVKSGQVRSGQVKLIMTGSIENVPPT